MMEGLSWLVYSGVASQSASLLSWEVGVANLISEAAICVPFARFPFLCVAKVTKYSIANRENAVLVLSLKPDMA